MDYIKILENKLSENDKILLKSVKEPAFITVPPENAWAHLCITDDGEIRHYGKMDFNGREGQRCYIASNDCGLSWKTYVVNNDKAMGRSVKSPYSGKYICVVMKSRAPVCRPGVKGAVALVSDKGFDSDEYDTYEISDLPLRGIRQIIPLKKRKRWIVMCEADLCTEGVENLDLVPVAAYSDDDGKTWSTSIIPPAPKHTADGPHKGVRWQNPGCEPTVAELADGTLMAVFRTSQDYHYISYSYDAGETWTQSVPSNFHGTLTMPLLLKLSDGRLVMLWCNTQPLPELDHKSQAPHLSEGEINGVYEDVFTNRDAAHIAISEDDGKTWIGFREFALNTIRNSSDFRTIGGDAGSHDKSVHQFDAVELPYGKILVSFGQHTYSRKIAILDIGWIYESGRTEIFDKGLINISTQVYVKSVSGNYRNFPGHCAWNRTNGALLMPDPDGIFEEALFISYIDDERLLSRLQGAVWNYPAAFKGRLDIRLRVMGEGIRISLADRWFNPIDEEIINDSQFSFIFDKKSDTWLDLSVVWDTEEKKACVYVNDKLHTKLVMKNNAPNGLCYLHLQGLHGDREGVYIKSLRKKDI